ncbi:MAG: nitrilase-related carbon-nitrogen hydrolase [Bacteroidota bacterium]
MSAWTQRHGVTLLTGAAVQAPGAARYNSALLFGPGQAPLRSDQTSAHPAFDGARFVEPPVALSQADPDWRLAQPDHAFESSPDKTLLTTQYGTLVPLIGFESLYSERTRRHALDGGDVLVVLAQNDWWGQLPSSHLHYAMARLLAVEHRRPVIVATVNGTMGMVLPSGRSFEQRSSVEGTAAYTVRFSAVDSPYLRYGNIVVRLGLFGLLGIAVLVALRTTILPRRVRVVPAPTAVMDYDDDQPDTYRPGGLAWPDTPTAYEDDAGPLGGDGHGGDGLSGSPLQGNMAAASRVTQPPSSPAAPWSASPPPSSSPPAPPAGADSSAPWASPSRFASPVTPKSSPPTSPPPKP